MGRHVCMDCIACLRVGLCMAVAELLRSRVVSTLRRAWRHLPSVRDVTRDILGFYILAVTSEASCVGRILRGRSHLVVLSPFLFLSDLRVDRVPEFCPPLLAGQSLDHVTECRYQVNAQWVLYGRIPDGRNITRHYLRREISPRGGNGRRGRGVVYNHLTVSICSTRDLDTLPRLQSSGMDNTYQALAVVRAVTARTRSQRILTTRSRQLEVPCCRYWTSAHLVGSMM